MPKKERTLLDNAIRIAAEELPTLFNRFFKPAASSGRPGSTGFGLGLCRWIAEVHHGRIDVDSAPGEGSTFTVWLPLIPPPSSA